MAFVDRLVETRGENGFLDGTTFSNARSKAPSLSSTPILRAISMKRVDSAGSSDFGLDLRGIRAE